MAFPDGIESTSIALEFDFRSGIPVGRYKTAEMEEFAEHPIQCKWVWDTEGEPDVMDLCAKVLQMVRNVIMSRDRMGFPD